MTPSAFLRLRRLGRFIQKIFIILNYMRITHWCRLLAHKEIYFQWKYERSMQYLNTRLCLRNEFTRPPARFWIWCSSKLYNLWMILTNCLHSPTTSFYIFNLIFLVRGRRALFLMSIINFRLHAEEGQLAININNLILKSFGWAFNRDLCIIFEWCGKWKGAI